MADDIFKTVGYHGTTARHKADIERNGFDPDKTNRRNDHWLGNGVYFFDNVDLAKWWADTLVEKSGSQPLVYSAEIMARKSGVLDLDRPEELNAFMNWCLTFYKDIKTHCVGKMPVFEPQQFRGVFFDYYKEKKHIAVVLCTFNKTSPAYAPTRLTGTALKQRTDLMTALGLFFRERQICVSNKGCIGRPEIAYNYEEEEII